MMLDRQGIQRLALVYTQQRLAHEFGVSLPTYRAYIRGREPKIAITDYINRKVSKMLGTKSIAVVALERYCNEAANHRLSVDESQEGPDSAYKVLRYPLDSCTQLYMSAANTLFLRVKDVDKAFSKHYPREGVVKMLFESSLISGTNRIDMTEGSGLEKRLAECYVIDLAEAELSDLRTMLIESAKKEEPEEDGRLSTQV